MGESGVKKLRTLNKGYEDDVAELASTNQLTVLQKTLRRLRGTTKPEKLQMYREAEAFRKVFSASSSDSQSDLHNLSYHIDNIKPVGLVSAAKAYLAWLCVYHREPNGEAEKFYQKTGLNRIRSPFRKFEGNPRDAFTESSANIRGEKLGYLDHGFANRVFSLRDWEIANHRVAQERRLKTGRLSFSKLRIDSLPETVSSLSWLNSLDCSVSLITDLPSLSNLSELESLDVSYSPIDRLPDLKGCSKLKVVFAGVSNIESLSGLGECKSLTSIFCGSTPVDSLEPLRSCENLSSLHCEDTWIKSLAGLEDCSRLKIMDCQDTSIEDLSPLQKCSDLTALFLNGCELTTSAYDVWNQESLQEVFFFRGKSSEIPAEKLSRSSDENCLPRIREFLRLRSPT